MIHLTAPNAELAHGAEPWDGPEAARLARLANGVFTDHFTGCRSARPWERDNCAGCVIGGYHSDSSGPNYAGWHRIYVEGRRTIPAKWETAFRDVVAEGTLYPDGANLGYRDALRRSIATFGVRFES